MIKKLKLRKTLNKKFKRDTHLISQNKKGFYPKMFKKK